MPNQDKSHITLILDRSGSMETIASDVIGAVNNFINEQKSIPGECTLTLVQFDDIASYEVIYDGPISGAKKLTDETYHPRGNTPLLDAIGKGIIDLGVKLAAVAEVHRPGKIIFVVQTDGLENASKEWTDRVKLAAIVKEQNEKYNWQFIFLGANQDAIFTGKGLNIHAGTSMTYTNSGIGTRSAMASTGSNVKRFRTGGSVASLNYSDEQRKQAAQS
jgi:hypothetical protein